MIDGDCLTDIRDNQGATIFHYTVFYNNPTVLEYLLSDLHKPSLVVAPDDSGRTPLQLAMYFGYVDLIELFNSYFHSFKKYPSKFICNTPDCFPLKDEFEVFEQEEVNSMPLEDFIMKDDQNKTLHKVLSSPVIGMLPELDEVKQVEEAVNQLIHQISMKVNKDCPLFSFEPRLSGS